MQALTAGGICDGACEAAGRKEITNETGVLISLHETTCQQPVEEDASETRMTGQLR